MAVNMSVKPQAWSTLGEPARGCKLRTTARSNCLRSCCGSPHLGRAVSTSRRRRETQRPCKGRQVCNWTHSEEGIGVFWRSDSPSLLDLSPFVKVSARKTPDLCVSTRRRTKARTRGLFEPSWPKAGRPHARLLEQMNSHEEVCSCEYICSSVYVMSD